MSAPQMVLSCTLCQAVAASRPTVLRSAFSWSPHLRLGLDQPAGVAAFSRLAASRGGSALAKWPKSRRRACLSYGRLTSSLAYRGVGDEVIPAVAKDPPQASLVKGVQVAFLCGCEGSSLCSIE
ncbi:hypothetical protein Bbelb_404880 [Branchiostoma belcheri]|nr:hypothetical protein Bbelb_404880 [Branchiostoma belcheri]